MRKIEKPLNNFQAFTLAEVLITLGIIGVVAAITIPTLITNYKKEQTVTQLKKVYSVLFQAIKMSEVENGPFLSWPEIGYGGSEYINNIFMKTYISPYISHIKDDEKGTITLKEGITINGVPQQTPGNQPGAGFIVDLNGDKKPNLMGKDKFYFKRQRNYFGGVEMDQNWLTRDRIKIGYASYSDCGCQYKNPTGNNNLWCTNLIINDGWQIKEDYPWD